MSTFWAFDHTEYKYTLFLGKYYMKKFYESLREETKNRIDFEIKKILPLTKEELKSHQDAKVCYNCEKRIFEKAL